MKPIHLLALFAFAATLTLAACGGVPSATPVAQPTPDTSAPQRTPGSVGVVPTPLQTIEGAAEDIIDLAPSGNWDKINADVAAIASAWQAYLPQATQDGADQKTIDTLSSALEQLKIAIANQDAAASMQSANAISAAVVDLFEVYHPAVPADIGRLDVYGRQIVLDVQAGNWEAARNSLRAEQEVFARLKQSLSEHNGADIIHRYEASLEAQEAGLQSRDATALINAAQDALEIVDAMESLYH
ncbi:MAG: hypothetical protein ACP5OO_12220 [Chloroflexia bacterium]|jgi:hypothetical protein